MEESPILGKKKNFRKRNNITPLIMVDIENVFDIVDQQF